MASDRPVMVRPEGWAKPEKRHSRLDALRVVAHLASPLGGDAPHLDSLLVFTSARLVGKDAESGYKIDRRFPAPTSLLPIPLLRTDGIARCTSPILGEVTSDSVEHIGKRIGVEHAGILEPKGRSIVSTTSEWTKSYRLPLRVRLVEKIVWLCVGDRKGILKMLRHIPAVGKKIADGYGRVERWECERAGDVPHDRWPWWIYGETGPVLMRPLPLGFAPPGLLGARQGFGACNDPYWHRDRYCELVEPC